MAKRRGDIIGTITLILLYAAACWKWGSWRSWREYYPTVLYVIIGDLAYNFVFHEHLLWQYQGLFNHTVADMIVAFFVFPSVIILFLTHWPKSCIKQASYVLAWTVLQTVIEYFSTLTGGMVYQYGWNIFWSFGLYALAFVLIRLHYRKPLLVWPISVALALATALIFGLPYDNLK